MAEVRGVLITHLWEARLAYQGSRFWDWRWSEGGGGCGLCRAWLSFWPKSCSSLVRLRACSWGRGRQGCTAPR